MLVSRKPPTCSTCGILGHRSRSTSCLKRTLPVVQDLYTAEVLRKQYTILRTACLAVRETIRETGLGIRMYNPPEDITENIVKFILIIRCGLVNCKWAKSIGVSGDLISNGESIEVKAFTSDGPASFGPRKIFNSIYFLDMRGWLEDRFILWHVKLTNESPEWTTLKMNKTETHKSQSDAGRRPRIPFEKIHQQIGEHCSKIYDGSFEGIFTANEGSALQ